MLEWIAYNLPLPSSQTFNLGYTLGAASPDITIYLSSKAIYKNDINSFKCNFLTVNPSGLNVSYFAGTADQMSFVLNLGIPTDYGLSPILDNYCIFGLIYLYGDVSTSF